MQNPTHPIEPPLNYIGYSTCRTCGLRCSVALSSISPSDSDDHTSLAEMEQVYDYVRAENKKKEMKILDMDAIELKQTLGAGNFGSVMYSGIYKIQLKNRTTKEVPVAVKVINLKGGDSPTAEA